MQCLPVMLAVEGSDHDNLRTADLSAGIMLATVARAASQRGN